MVHGGLETATQTPGGRDSDPDWRRSIFRQRVWSLIARSSNAHYVYPARWIRYLQGDKKAALTRCINYGCRCSKKVRTDAVSKATADSDYRFPNDVFMKYFFNTAPTTARTGTTKSMGF